MNGEYWFFIPFDSQPHMCSGLRTTDKGKTTVYLGIYGNKTLGKDVFETEREAYNGRLYELEKGLTDAQDNLARFQRAYEERERKGFRS